MIDKKTFKKSVGRPLENAGFIKKGQSWYLDGKDTLVVFNLEKRDMGFDCRYDINVGFWLKALGEPVFPSYNHCHLYYRIERLFPEQQNLILTGCSLDQNSSQDLEALTQFIENRAIQFLRECTHEEKIRALFAQGVLENGFVKLEVRWYLNENHP